MNRTNITLLCNHVKRGILTAHPASFTIPTNDPILLHVGAESHASVDTKINSLTVEEV